MKRYIQISKNYFEGVADNATDTNIKLNQLITSLSSVASFINLTDEEKEALRSACEIINNKVEAIEDLIDDPNNQFYDINNIDID